MPTPPSMDAAPPATNDKKSRVLLKGGFYWGTGRRTTAVARVRIKAGEGQFMINERPADAYFHNVRDREEIVAPLRVAESLGKLDVRVKVHGGGPSGQAGAIVLGVSRALVHLNPQVEAK